jgi:hypothetical protein
MFAQHNNCGAFDLDLCEWLGNSSLAVTCFSIHMPSSGHCVAFFGHHVHCSFLHKNLLKLAVM